jgi:hypothetical protein
MSVTQATRDIPTVARVVELFIQSRQNTYTARSSPSYRAHRQVAL